MTERSIFLAALDRDDPAERATYLEQACAGDVELRRRIESLLEAHNEPGEFLEPPAIGDATAQLGDDGPDDRPAPRSVIEGPGSRIGPYRLLQQIGEGGMGVVYMAEQEKPIRRKVALKIIKPGMDTGQVVARFEAERQALALMDHPNIARVLDAGTTDSGRPYFVMDLVKGIPVTQFCDEAKLSPRERLDLFVPVCQAIQHAHQKGIIHRDVKPTNVMVTLHDGKPVPKIIDFGVAKATDQRLTERTLFTQYGAIIGTPEYMSPEQAELSGLDVDTRTDIFSLGVLLYELLTGTTPLERAKLREASYGEILKRIKEEEAPKPSTRISHSGDRLASIAAMRRTEPGRLTRLVRGELDWIVMKALEKDRARRYETANGLARDIQRYLDGEPVDAGPPSALYALQKFARKHRVALATVAAFAILLVMASVVSMYLAIRATRAERAARTERNRAMAAEGEAMHQRDRAVEAEREAKSAAERATTEAAIARSVNEFLQQDLLGQADVDNQARPGQRPDPDIKVRTLLDRAAASIGGKFADQPAVEVAIRRTIGETYVALGLYSWAESHLALSVSLARQELGEEHPGTLNAIVSLASLYVLKAEYAKAEPLFVQALAGLRRAQGEEHPDSVRATYWLANLYFWQGNFSKSESHYDRTLTLSRKVLGEDNDLTLWTIAELTMLYLAEGKLVECEDLTRKTLDTNRRIRGEDHSLTIFMTGVLALLYQHQGRYAQADELYSQVLARKRRTRGSEEYDTLRWTVWQASSFIDQGNSTRAEELLAGALDGFRRTLGEHHALTYWAVGVRAETCELRGKSAEAEALYSQALDGSRRVRGNDHPSTLFIIRRLAGLFLSEGRPEKAEPLLIAAQKTSDTLNNEGNIRGDSTACTLARLRLAQQRPAEAEPLAHRALSIGLQRYPDHWSRYDALTLVGAALAGQKKYAEAEPLLLEGYQGLKEREERIPFLWRKRRPAEAGARIVDLYDAWGKQDEAERWRNRLNAEKSNVAPEK